MKMRNILVLALSLVLFTNCFAQKENKKKEEVNQATDEVNTNETNPAVEEPAVEEPPIVTEECLMNISLFNESAKNKQYADALEPWNAAYNQCPGAHKAIYFRGPAIIQWELSQTKDKESYQKVFDKLMKMYDNRIKYFGDDEKYPTSWILGVKGLDYYSYAKYDELKKPAYEYLEQSIDGMKENSMLDVLRIFIVLSNDIYKADSTHAEKYVNDYVKVNSILEIIAADADQKKTQDATELKNGLDGLFIQSSVAECKTLDRVFKEKVAKNLSNVEYLNNVVSFYKKIRCTESDVYFSAAVALHNIQPSAESANGCAEMSIMMKDFSKAIEFYEEATNLTGNKIDKAEYQYKIAQLYSNLDGYSKAREAARKSLDYNPDNGKPYLLIGKLYAGSKVSDDPVLKKTIYWVAVDKFIKAKQIDITCIEEANELIKRYTSGFPSKEDIFMHPDLKEGSSYTVGGWIGERTICRY